MGALVNDRPNRNREDLEQRIERYLAGDLDPIELDRFKREIEQDPLLETEVVERAAEHYDRQVQEHGLTAFMQEPYSNDGCYSMDTLTRYVRGELEPRDTMRVEAHLQCSLCGSTVESLRQELDSAGPGSGSSGPRLVQKAEQEPHSDPPSPPRALRAAKPGPIPTEAASAHRPRLWFPAAAAIGLMSLAVAIALIQRGEPQDRKQLMARVEAQLSGATRSFEGRLSLPEADHHRPYDTHLGGTTLHPDPPDLPLLDDLHKAKHHRAVAALYLAADETRLARRALEQAQRTAQSLSDLAAVSLAEAKPGQALRLAEEALTLEPGLVQARWNRAVALQRLSRTDEARQAFQALADDLTGGWAQEAARRAGS